MSKRAAFNTSRREKRNVPEIQPPEPNFIERIHSKKNSIKETDLKCLIRIKDQKLKKTRSDYIYQINFTKDSLLQQIYANSFCFLNLYSITFPPSLSIVMPESFKGCLFLKDINFLSNDTSKNILEICDDAFRDTMIESIVIPKNTKKIYSTCFPKTLTQIEFENGCPKLEKIGNKAFFQTQIESFKFPLKIKIFICPKNIFLQCKKLKTLIFDSYANKNDKLQSEKEEELFEKERRIERKFKFNNALSKLNKSIENLEKNNFYKDIERSQDFAKSNLISQTKVEKIEVFFSNLNYFYFFNTPKLTSITVGEGENNRYIKINGCIYTKDKNKLIVAERNIKSATVSSSCQIIMNYAFNIKSLEKVDFEKNSELKEISFFAFSESKIKKIDVPDSVDLIDYCAFYKCEKLETINIPKSINSIDFFTFSFTNLTKILIPKKVIKISFGSFFKCSNLTTITFESDSNLVEIDDFAFSSTKIKSISIPKSVKRIGNYSFLNCNYLETVTFDKNTEILTIGDQCFNGTKIDESQLKGIYQKVGYLYENLDSNIFFLKTFNKESLTLVKFPKDIQTIDRNAFKDCINLSKVEMNPFISKIMDGAFSNCSSLTELEIPKNIKYLGKCCFQNCLKYEKEIHICNQQKVHVGTSAFENSGLISFHLESNSIVFGKSAFKGCKNLVEFEANAKIEYTFGSSVFKDCKKMEVAIISPNAYKISFGKCCFMNTAIQKFIVPDNLEELPEKIFKNCSKLKEIKIDEDNSKIKFIKSEAFTLSGIEKICIPSATRIIENNSFNSCQKLNSVHFSPIRLLKIKFSCFENCQNLKEVVMPKAMTIEKIEENAFKGCSIESITFPKSVNLVQKHAFLKCNKLKSITFLGECIIDTYAFLGCKNIESIKTNSILKVHFSFSDYPSITLNIADLKLLYFIFHEDITNKEIITSLFINEKPTFQSYKILNYKHSLIFNDGFGFGDNLDFIYNDKHNNMYTLCQNIDGGYYMNSKKSIYFADSSIESLCILKEARFIEKSAFKFSNLKKIDFQSGSKLEKIKKCSFMNLGIEEISLPDSLISIGKEAFYNCKMLKKINITPQSKLKIIKSNAFEKSGVESFVFPSTLEKISKFAFFECFKLKEIENHSAFIKFGYKSFCRSGIEKIKFPSKSIFKNSSFKECALLKEIVFNGEKHEVVFGPESFALSGLETFKIDNDFDINENAFIFCNNLKEIYITCKNENINANAFNFCTNIEEFTLIRRITNNIAYDDDYFKDIITSVSHSFVKKFLLKVISLTENNSEKEQKILLENNCFVYNNTLFGVNLIDNISSFKESSESTANEIKGNEIIKVPSCVEKINFSSFTFNRPLFTFNFSIDQIKQIKWSKDCIVNDLGTLSLFSYSNLVEITIPKSVQKIPPHLFEHCHFMKKVQFEKGSILNEIGEYAFSDTSIEKVNLPDTVKIIKKSAFSYNLKLKEVSFQGEIIEEETFFETGLQIFKLSNNTQIIGSNAFQYCRFLKTFEIDIDKSKLSEIGPFAFYETSITEINIPPDIKVIQNSVFNGCKYLKRVNISNKSKLTEIKEYSFSGNLSLETINIPKSISKLSFKAFINTPSLIKIMNESNTQFKVKSKKEVYIEDNSLIFVPRNLKEFEVNHNCSIIHSGSFCGPNLEKVSFQDESLTIIEESGFAHSTSLKSIEFPKSIKHIGKDAFIECTNLETVLFDSNCKLKMIPKFCFAFSGLKNIVLPRFVEIIDQSSFYFCEHLKNINLYDTNISFIGESAFSGSGIENIRFPPTIQFISNHSFEETKMLTIVDFSSCSNIEDSKYSKSARDFISKNKKNKKKMEEIQSSNSFPDLSQTNNTSINASNALPLIVRPSVGNTTPQNSCNQPLKSQSPLKPAPPPKESLSRTSPRIKPLRPKLNITCHVCESAFYRSNVSIFKFELKEYQWFDFFDKCNQFKEYSLNSNILIYLKILPDGKRYFYSIKDYYNKVNYFEQINIVKPVIEDRPFDYIFDHNLLFLYIQQVNVAKKCITNDFVSPSLFTYSNLVEITIPKSVQKIPPHLFEHCHFMKKVQFEKGSILNEIGEYAFSDTSIEKVNLPDTVKIIKKSAFSYNLKLKEVSFQGEIIEEETFFETGLQIFKLSNNTQIIGSNAFQYCRFLKTFEIDIDKSKLSEIGPFAFYETSITEINIPPDIKVIQNSVFNGCKYLKRVNISNKSKLTEIKEHSFSGNLSLETINIPKSISKLSFKAFINTPSLIKIMNESNTQFKVKSKKEVYMEDNSLIFVPRNLKEFEVNNNCSIIHSGSFCGPNLEKVSFQDESLTIIEESGFAHSTSLKKIIFPKSIKHIGKDAFIECANLETVLFDSNCKLKVIPKFCFAFSGLKNIVLPRFVEIIDQSSFYFCEHLKNIDLYDTNISFIGESAFSGSGIENIRFPPTIQFISNHSFEETKMLTIVDFSSCIKVENYYNKSIKNVHELILEIKKNKNKMNINKIKNSNSFPEPSQKTSETPPKNAKQQPLIIRPSIGNTTPRNSYNQPLKNQIPHKPTAPSRESLSRASPRINKSKTSDEFKLSKPKHDATCLVCESAFYRSNASIFKFELNEYQWFDFFDKCNRIKEYSLNSDILIYLRKLSKERLHYFSRRKTKLNSLIKVNDHLLGSCYKVSQIFWQGKDMIPWKLYGPKLKSIPKQLNPLHFINTSNLISINFTDDIQIENIPKCCFSFTLLEEIRIPKSVKLICRSAFQYCNGLRKVAFSPDIQLKEIENYAFFDCKNLNSISLPNTISAIPEFCFASSGIKKIKLPKSIQTIYSGAFHHCDDLNSIIFNEGLEEIGCSSFSNCKSLIKIELPDSLTKILPHAFSGCFNLREVNIKPESKLAFIKEGAFDFTSIEQLKLNSGIEEICNIKNMPKLEKISFHEGKLSHFHQSKDGIVYQLVSKITGIDSSNEEESTSNEKQSRINDVDFLIDSLQIKHKKDFSHLWNEQNHIKKIIFIPKNATCLKYSDDINICGDFEIENDDCFKIIIFFYDIFCSYKKYPKDYFVQLNQITHMKFTSKFVVFHRELFSNFNSITSVEFGENVNLFEINSGLFKNCPNLHKVIIPNSCVRICYEAFSDCVNLKTLLFGKVDKSREKKHSLKIIGCKAFYNCSSIQNIVLPPTVQRIESCAFMNCKNLKRIEFGILHLNDENKTSVHYDKEHEKLDFIGNSAFKNCSSLSSFRLPQFCKDILMRAFINCTSLTKISGTNLHLNKIESGAFLNCSSLTSFHISISDSIHYIENEEEDIKEGKEKEIYFNNFEIKSSCFMNCTSLNEFVIENESKNIDTMKQDKQLCRSKICVNAFANCTSLAKAQFFIGNLNQIDRNAFKNCSLLKTIEINSPSYQSIVNDDKTSFQGCHKDLTLELFNENKKVNSFKIIVKKYKHSSKALFKEHLSFLNKDFLLWNVKEDEKKKKEKDKKEDKLESSVPNSLDEPVTTIVKTDLTHENEKADSFIFSSEKPRHSSRLLFKEHLSFLNKDLLSWPVKEEEEKGKKKVKLHSTVLKLFDGPVPAFHLRYKTTQIEETPGPANYNHFQIYGIGNHGFRFTFHFRTQFPVGPYNEHTEYNYTIPTPRPPLNI